MESLLALAALVLLLLALVAPVLSLISFVRGLHLRTDVRDLTERLAALETRVSALVKTGRTEHVAQPAPPAPATPMPVAPSAPSPRTPAEPTAPPVAPPPPEPAFVMRVPAPARLEARIPGEVAPPETLVPPAPRTPPPATRLEAPTAGPPRTPEGPPPAARPERRAPPPPPAAPAFDWESLLGLRGAAWVGGIAVVIAALLFAKWAIDENIITPELRIGLMVLVGLSGLVGAELSLRRGYETTANAVSGAGIAILYAAFFAAHSFYRLLPMPATFFFMALVTVVACLLSIRYDALFVAILGLLGGFATPLVLSTGVDRPVGFFSYILLLNLGLLAVALKKRWHLLATLTLLATFGIELAWFGRHMAPEKALIGLSAFLVFGLLYLLLPHLAATERGQGLLSTSLIGGVAPFVFAVLIAGNRAYAGEWPILFGFIGLLDLALAAIALYRGQWGLLLAGSIATTLTLPLWASHGLGAHGLWGPTLAAIVVVFVLNAPKRLAAALDLSLTGEQSGALEAAGLIGGAGLASFTLVLVHHRLGEPPWAFAALLAALIVILLERTTAARLPGVMLVGAPALAVVVQAWFFRSTAGETLLRNLSLLLLLTMVLSLVGALRASRRTGETDADNEDAGAVVAAAAVGILGLFGCLGSTELGGDPWPLFAALAVNLGFLLFCVLWRDWTPLIPAALVATAAHLTAWHTSFFHPWDATIALPSYVVFYLGFLVLPFAIPRAQGWVGRASPWVGSALSGPLFFYVLYSAITRTWGKAWIGALPVLLAALSVAALARVARCFAARPADAQGQQRRLGFLALFAAIALGFVALAIPLQLDRQWITIAWALEAAAVWWLFGRLPHPGLKYLGALLFALAGVRLLLNPELLRYQPRGLPILNWLLYTYGVPALCCLLGARWLRRAEQDRQGEVSLLPPAASLLGLILLFALLNLEIFDYFSAGRYLELAFERRYERDLALSLGWGLYAISLLVIGVWRRVPPLRFISLGFLILTVGKVFLYDLSTLRGIFRVFSFLGLGVALILVSLFYQRFVLSRERRS